LTLPWSYCGLSIWAAIHKFPLPHLKGPFYYRLTSCDWNDGATAFDTFPFTGALNKIPRQWLLTYTDKNSLWIMVINVFIWPILLRLNNMKDYRSYSQPAIIDYALLCAVAAPVSRQKQRSWQSQKW